MTVLVRQDPKTGERFAVPLEGEETTLSVEDSPDTVTARFEEFHKCGHHASTEVGGRCFECGGTSCTACHRQCACGKPLCPECALIVGTADQVQPLCRRCYDEFRRRYRTRRVLRALAMPFLADRDGAR